jgi:hypothetical protein
VLEVFHKTRKAQRGGIDRGGKENIFRATHGHEKEALVRDCIDLFCAYGLDDRITSTETGPFFEFVSHVYDLAVGDVSTGESPGLIDPIKRRVRDFKKVMAQVNSLVNRGAG